MRNPATGGVAPGANGRFCPILAEARRLGSDGAGPMLWCAHRGGCDRVVAASSGWRRYGRRVTAERVNREHARSRVQVVPYSPEWPVLFERESQVLAGALGKAVAQIHHIGSTSVPDLYSKDTLDILVVTPDVTLVLQRERELDDVGYHLRDAASLHRCFFRRLEGGLRRVHLHAGCVAIPRSTSTCCPRLPSGRLSYAPRVRRIQGVARPDQPGPRGVRDDEAAARHHHARPRPRMAGDERCTAAAGGRWVRLRFPRRGERVRSRRVHDRQRPQRSLLPYRRFALVRQVTRRLRCLTVARVGGEVRGSRDSARGSR